jgi:hypothetical protein
LFLTGYVVEAAGPYLSISSRVTHPPLGYIELQGISHQCDGGWDH